MKPENNIVTLSITSHFPGPPVAARRKVVPTDGDVRVFLLQYSRILLKHLLVSSGVAVHEPDGRAHELGQLWLRNVLLTLNTWKQI